MFYDAFAALVSQSGDALEARQRSPSDDSRFLREGRQIATLLRRTGAVWDDLFETLAAETTVLERGLERANLALADRGLDTQPTPSEAAPLERYRAVQRALDATIERLAPLTNTSPTNEDVQAWARATLREIRGSLGDAAEIQGRLVDRMLQIR